MADRTGRRKAVTVFVLAMSSAFRLLLVYAADDVTLFGMLLLLSSIFYSAVASLVDSIVVSSLPESDRSDFGRLRLFGSLGNGLASCLVMWMGQDRFVPDVFRLDAASSALAVAGMVACLPTEGGRRGKDEKDGGIDKRFTRQESYARGTREVFGNAQILALFATVVVMGCSLSVMENFAYIQIGEVYESLPPAQAADASRDLGMYRAAFTVGGVATAWFSGRLQRVLGPDAVMTGGICCLPLTFFLYVGFPPDGSGGGLGMSTRAAFLAAEFVRSAIFNLVWFTATVRLTELAPASVRSSVQSLMESIYRGLGCSAGSYLGGLLCTGVGIEAAFVAIGRGLTALICAAAAARWIVLGRGSAEEKVKSL